MPSSNVVRWNQNGERGGSCLSAQMAAALGPRRQQQAAGRQHRAHPPGRTCGLLGQALAAKAARLGSQVGGRLLAGLPGRLGQALAALLELAVGGRHGGAWGGEGG